VGGSKAPLRSPQKKYRPGEQKNTAAKRVVKGNQKNERYVRPIKYP